MDCVLDPLRDALAGGFRGFLDAGIIGERELGIDGSLVVHEFLDDGKRWAGDTAIGRKPSIHGGGGYSALSGEPFAGLPGMLEPSFYLGGVHGVK